MALSKLEELFHKGRDFMIKLLVIMHADKINAKKKKKTFLDKAEHLVFEIYKNVTSSQTKKDIPKIKV